MHTSVTPQSGKSYTHLWDVGTTREFEGGFLFNKATVPAGTEKLPKGILLKVDQVERKATMVKTAVLHEAITALSTAVKIEKGSLLLATDIIGNGTAGVEVGTIDTSNAAYDSFAITADDFGALAAGAILQQMTAAAGAVVNPDGFNYTEVTLDAEPTCSVIYEAKGIRTGNLPQGITSAIKTALKFCQFLS